MSDDAAGSRGSVVYPEGYAVPITGLLAMLFAVIAGVTAYPALSGSPDLASLSLPVIFGLASLYCMRLRSNYRAKRERGSGDESDGS